jgi:hypothetical protein
MVDITFVNLCKDLKQRLNWDRIYKFRAYINSHFNGQSERFLKSRLVESFIAKESNGLLVYVDLPGKDWWVPEYGEYLEGKGSKDDVPRNGILKPRLKNGNSGHDYTGIPTDYAKFIMFYYRDCFRVAKRDVVENYISLYGGNIEVRLPISETTLLSKSDSFVFEKARYDPNKSYEAMLNDIIIQFNKQTFPSHNAVTAYME